MFSLICDVLIVASLPAIAGVHGVAGVPTVALAVAGAPAIDGILALASVPA